MFLSTAVIRLIDYLHRFFCFPCHKLLYVEQVLNNYKVLPSDAQHILFVDIKDNEK